MHSPTPSPDRGPSEENSRPHSPPAAGTPPVPPTPLPAPSATPCAPDDAINTPVLPHRIHLPSLVICFQWGPARYRTAPLKVVAERLSECGAEGEETGGWRMEDRTLNPVALSSPSERSAPPPNLGPRTLDFGLYPPYSLRKELGVWHLTFAGRAALLRHERGLLYVAWLLQHPPAQPIHAVDLAAQIPELYRAQLGLGALTDPATGQSAPLPSHARLQERSLALDDAQALRALHRKEQELEALLDDESECEPVKAEALRELEAIAQFLRQHGRRSRDAAQRTVRTVRKAIQRLHAHLAAAVNAPGAPHPVLRPFAEHLQRYLLTPSGRYDTRGNRHARTGLAGCFTYEPPPGVKWSG